MRQGILATLAILSISTPLAAQAPRTQVIGHQCDVRQILQAFPMSNGDFVVVGEAGAEECDIDPGTTTSTFLFDPAYDPLDQRRYPFIQRLQPDGRVVWYRQLPSLDDLPAVLPAPGGHFTLDMVNATPFDADPGPGTTTVLPGSLPFSEAFAEFNPSGNLVQATQVGQSAGQPWFRVNQDEGFFLLVHMIYGTSDIDPGSAVLNITDIDNDGDLLITRHRPNGTLLSYRHYPMRAAPSSASTYLDILPTQDGGFSFALSAFDALDILPEPDQTYNISSNLGVIGHVDASGLIGRTDEHPVRNDAYAQTFKFNPDGTYFTWSSGTISHHGLNLIQTYALATPEIHDLTFAQGRLWVVATFSGTTDIDPGPGTVTLPDDPNAGLVLATLDSATAQVQWAGLQGRRFEHHIPRLYTLADGSVLEILQFQAMPSTVGTVDVDPGPAVHPVVLDEAGNECAARTYYLRLGADASTATPTEGSMTVFPNPLPQGQSSLSVQLGEASSSGYMELFDPTGRLVKQWPYLEKAFVEVELPAAPGLYLLRAYNGSTRATTKVIRR